MSFRRWFSALALVALLGGLSSPQVQTAEPKSAKDLASFGTYRALSVEAARTQAQDWLKSVGKTDAASTQAFQAIWAQTDRPVLDLVSETLALAVPDVKKVLESARDVDAAAPVEVPALIKDPKQAPYFRANLALAYAKALSGRRVYEESLDALKTVKPEQVVDPAAYFFHKAVAEHSLLMKNDATRSIARLLDDVADAPDRYKTVAALMFADMQDWKDKDLADISRKMSNIERRLDLARGGPQTQKMQKDVLARLDELIKKLENQSKGSGSGGDPNGGGCPAGGQPSAQPGNTNQPSSPQNDSVGGTNSGPGNVDPKKFREIAEVWGKLPEKDRAKARVDMIRSMPPEYRQMIESFYKKTASSGTQP